MVERWAARRTLFAPAALVAAGALAATLAPRAALASNGAAPIAISGRAAGRGGADTAVADDAISLFSNPAGMLRVGRWRFDAQNTIVVGRDRFVNDRNDELSTGAVYFDPALGAIVDPSQADGDLRFGLALAVPFGGGGSTKVRSELYPDGEKESLEFFDARIGPAVAWRARPNVRIGAGVYFDLLSFEARTTSTSSEGEAKGIVRRHRTPGGEPIDPPEPVLVDGEPVTYNELFSLASTPDSNSSSIVELEQAFAYGVSANIGLQWDVTDRITLGIAYSSPAFFGPAKGTARVDGTEAIGAIAADPDIAAITNAVFETFLPDGAAAQFKARYDYEARGYTSPMSISLGLAFWATERVLLAADFRWLNWSRAIDTLKVTLSDGDNENINEINGGDTIEARVKQKWKDIYVAAVGGSWAATDWLTLRLGYNFSTSPIRKNRQSPGLPSLEHHVAGGFTVHVSERAGITAAVVYAIPRETGNEVHPTNPTFSFTRFKQDQTFVYVGVSIDVW